MRFKSEEEYANLRLGSYIDGYILKEVTKEFFKKFSKDKSSANSTIGSKLEFCNKAISFVNTENMTKMSVELVKEILDFVVSKN